MRDDSRDPRVASAADEASQEESCVVPEREGEQRAGGKAKAEEATPPPG